MSKTHVFTHSVATKQCNGDKKYLLSGNIAPHQWYKIFCDEDGNPDLVSITNLADVLAWYRNGTSDQFGYNSPKFVGDSLCVSYDYFEDKFGFRKDRVRRSFVRLEEQGVLKRTVKNIELTHGTRVNRIFITLDIDFFNSCFSDPALDIRVKCDLPTNDLHINSSALTPCTSNSIGSLHQCNHHISNKNKIKKDRSMIYASSEAQSRSSFLENSLDLKEKANNNHNKFLEISTSSIDKNNNALALQILSDAKLNLNTDNQVFSQVKNPSIDKKPRKLKDFYPLNVTDCTELQSLSKREFSLNAMNEILLDMSRRLTHPIFYSKKGFISYMTNAFKKEMRDAVKTSNESFKIKANQSLEESRSEEIEKYLT